MNYKELKARIRDLGFEDDEAINENIELVISGINTAINTISSTVRPVIETYILEKSDKESGIVRYDFSKLVQGFLGFYKNPRMIVDEELKLFSDYQIENNKTLILKGSFIGELFCYYKKQPTQINSKTLDDFEIELDLVVHELVPLLAAYYIWLDDDNTKATQYQNLYDSLKNEIMATSIETSTLKINGGISWRN